MLKHPTESGIEAHMFVQMSTHYAHAHTDVYTHTYTSYGQWANGINAQFEGANKSVLHWYVGGPQVPTHVSLRHLCASRCLPRLGTACQTACCTVFRSACCAVHCIVWVMLEDSLPITTLDPTLPSHALTVLVFIRSVPALSVKKWKVGARTHVRTHAHACVLAYVCACACAHVCVCLCVCACVRFACPAFVHTITRHTPLHAHGRHCSSRL